MTNKNIVQPTYNSFINSWNVPLNANFQNIDDSLGTVQAFNLASASGTVNVSATVFAGAYPANTPSYVPLIWTLTGTMTANVKLQLPSGIGGQWIVNNAATGFTVTISSAGGGTSIAIGGGVTTFYSDGTNVGVVSNSSFNGGNNPTFRNVLVNGDFTVNQIPTPTLGVGSNYVADQWILSLSSATAANMIWGISSGGAPNDGNYIALSNSGPVSLGSTDQASLQQPLEGSQVYPAQFGTSGAKALSLSFWVLVSVAGTYGGSIANFAGNRSYCFSYNVPTPATWTYITVFIPGDTGGSWVNGASANGSMLVRFGYGYGGSFQGTAGIWQNGNFVGPTGCVNAFATNGASLQFAQVQLEIAPAASAFEFIPFNIQLYRCYRYFQNTNPVWSGSYSSGGTFTQSSNLLLSQVRVSPSITAASATLSNVSSIAFSNRGLDSFVALITVINAGGWGVTVTGLLVNAQL